MSQNVVDRTEMDRSSNKTTPSSANGEDTSGAYAAPSVPNLPWTLAVATPDPQELARCLASVTGIAGDRSTDRARIAAATCGASSDLEAGATASSSRDDARSGQGSMSEQETKLQQAISAVRKRHRTDQQRYALSCYIIGVDVNAALNVAEDRDAALERISEECGLSYALLEECADLARVFTYDGFKRLVDQRVKQDHPWSIDDILELAQSVKALAEMKGALLELAGMLQAECQKPAAEWGFTAELDAADGSMRELYRKVGGKLREVLVDIPESTWRIDLFFQYSSFPPGAHPAQ